MRPFPHAARVRIRDKRPVKERVEDTVDRMVQEPVTNARFVNVARFRIGDFERMITAMAVIVLDNLITKLYDIIHKVEVKFLNVRLRSFSRKKFLPRRKQVFGRGNGLEFFFELYFHGKY